jgi:hypothetical protein
MESRRKVLNEKRYMSTAWVKARKGSGKGKEEKKEKEE